MATFYIVTASLPLLILAAIQGCSGVDQSSLNESTLVTTLKEISQTLKLLEEVMQNSTSLHEQNVDALRNLSTLPNKIDTLTADALELKKLIADYKETVEPEKPAGWTQKCQQQQNLQYIKEVVQKFNSSNNWEELKRDLESAVDYRSTEYEELEETEQLAHIGFSGYIQLATLLLCADLPVDATSGFLDHTMMHGAAWNGFLSLMKLLLDRGANIDLPSKVGNTPLMLAVSDGNLEVVKWLVQAGANTTIKDINGDTALSYAKSSNETAIAQYLWDFPH